MSCYNSTVPSSPPRDVMVAVNNKTSLRVSWKSPLNVDRNGEITGFVINYTSVESDYVMIMYVNSTSENSHIITGLVAFAEYSVGVAAVNINGTGPFSDAVKGRPRDNSEYNDNVYILYMELLFTLLRGSNTFNIPDTM